MEKDKDVLNDLDSIFHYTKCNVALENILYSSSLKFGTIANSSDPIEYRRRALSYGFENTPDNPAIPIEVIKTLIANTKFISFCRNTKNQDYPKGYLKSRMWSQYAESHKGVCLVFNRGELYDGMFKQIPVGSRFFEDNVTYPFKYHLGEHMILDFVSEDKKHIADVCLEYLYKNRKSIFFKKNIDYKSERECRFVVCDGKVTPLKVSVEGQIKAVVLGNQVNRIYHSLFRKLAVEKNFKLYKVDIDGCGRFGVKEFGSVNDI